MQVEIVTEEPEFLALESIWNPLLQGSNIDTVFLTFEWLFTWWRHFGQGNQLFVVVVKNQGQIVGLAPLMITIREGFRQFTMIGGKTTDYKDFIIAEDQDREAIIEAVFNVVIREKSWDCFQLNGFREDSPNFRPVMMVLPRFQRFRPVCYEYNVSPYVPIDGSWEGYWDSLKKSFRENSKRRMSRLNQEKGIVSYHHPTSQEEVDLYMDELIKQHIVRWKDTAKMYSIFERAATASFYKDLAKQLFAKRWLSLPVLLVNGEVAAVNFGFEYGGKYLRCFPTFRDDFAKYSVARLLLIHLLQDAFTRGLTELDLLTGKQPYKLDLNPHLRRLYRISLSQRSIKGYASERWLLEIRPRLETLSKENAYLQQLNAWLLRVGFRKR